MIEPILYGFALGFALCFTFGPVFFALIQTSIDTHFKNGVMIALGVGTTDAILMFVAVFGTAFLPSIPYFKDFLSIAGAILLIGLGVMSFFAKRKQLIYPQTPLGNFVYYFSKGFFLNLFNPANYAFIFATSLSLRNALHFDTTQVVVFFGTSVVAAVVAESLIAYYARRLKKNITDLMIVRINKVAGAIFIIGAIRILWNYFS